MTDNLDTFTASKSINSDQLNLIDLTNKGICPECQEKVAKAILGDDYDMKKETE